MKENEIGENGYGSMFLVLDKIKARTKNTREREMIRVFDS